MFRVYGNVAPSRTTPELSKNPTGNSGGVKLSTICRNFLLGKCSGNNCKRVHPAGSDLEYFQALIKGSKIRGDRPNSGLAAQGNGGKGGKGGKGGGKGGSRITGQCRTHLKGSKCPDQTTGKCLLMHDPELLGYTKGKACRSAQEGKDCKFGDKCAFEHDMNAVSYTATAQLDSSPVDQRIDQPNHCETERFRNRRITGHSECRRCT